MDNWRDIYQKYPTDIIMTYKDTETYILLQEDSDWVHIFDGKLCGIFVKKGTEKFTYLEPEYNIDYYRNTMFKHGDFRND